MVTSNKQLKYQTIAKILQQTASLQPYVTKILTLAELDLVLKAHLEPQLAANCRVANLNQGTLVLATTNPTWRHHLRFLTTDLLSNLRKQPEWSHLANIEVIVQPQSQDLNSINAKEPLKLSLDNANLLLDTAKQCKNYKLATALIKLVGKLG